jgi:hypothetical protein
MISDPALRQDLQFLCAQPSWAYKEVAGHGKAEVIKPTSIANQTGVYWVAGTSTLRGGRKLDSVFRVDTNAGGTLISVYWKIGSQWHFHDDLDVLPNLGLVSDEVFPFDWSFAIPLEYDIFHPESDDHPTPITE